ncbi:MAG: hypothetical protein HF982_14115 [Desulfobacteraceae bacterium]|nr:hypothetical protein [Desulfobacteraceae bacterium]MBC2720693.1 hypothetical protein [Desulfobacteraceae bacterium]
MNLFFEKIKYLGKILKFLLNGEKIYEEQKLILGSFLSRQVVLEKITNIFDAEFKIFSQWGDDGIIQWLIHNIEIQHKSFIEFGVDNYQESTSRFLMMNNNWSGYIIDGSKRNIKRIKNSSYYWRFELEAKHAFVDRKNIVSLIKQSSVGNNIGLLHIDIDGNDYWVWEVLEIRPEIVIIEYNSVFGNKRSITVRYQENFDRTKAHYSNLYFGASLPALCYLAEKKGYSFIGCTSSGNNAYFVRNDKTNKIVKKVEIEHGYVCSKARESRDKKGNLTFITGMNRLQAIKGMPVTNVITGELEVL